MASRSNEPRGIRDAAKDAVDSGLDYARARGALLRLEAAEAKERIRGISIAGAIGAFLFTVGYTLALYLATRFVSREWFGDQWQFALAAVAGVHLLLGAVFLLAARARARRSNLFRSSIAQLERDRIWLQELQDEIKSRR